MKTQLHAFILFISFTFSIHSIAQTVTCELFTITGMEPDSFNPENTLINIEMSGDFEAFANYPYISTVMDCVGDTIATGDMWFFGQVGGTTQGYPVTAIPGDVCLPITIEFVFGNDLFETDTCLLSYGVSGLNPFKKPDFGVQLFPNPANDIIQVASQTDLTGKNYFILNATGKLVHAGRITTSNVSLDVSQLPSGFYVLTIDGTSSRFMKH